MSSPKLDLPKEFTSKPIQRTTLKRFQNAVISIDAKSSDVSYRVRGKEVESLSVRTFEGLVCDNPDGTGCLVTFRHPRNPEKQVVGVVLVDPDTRPEIDGVWVADDGGGKDDPNGES
ncbi:MAG: hypothetical protein AAGM22_20535 [Acidobacteriota bacterium]